MSGEAHGQLLRGGLQDGPSEDKPVGHQAPGRDRYRGLLPTSGSCYESCSRQGAGGATGLVGTCQPRLSLSAGGPSSHGLEGRAGFVPRTQILVTVLLDRGSLPTHSTVSIRVKTVGEMCKFEF